MKSKWPVHNKDCYKISKHYMVTLGRLLSFIIYAYVSKSLVDLWCIYYIYMKWTARPVITNRSPVRRIDAVHSDNCFLSFLMSQNACTFCRPHARVLFPQLMVIMLSASGAWNSTTLPASV